MMFELESKYKHLFCWVAVFIAIIFVAVLITIDPEFKAGLFNRPDKDDYERLTSYVNIYAKTLDRNAIPDPNVEITAYYTQKDRIIITAEERWCKVDAVYPMLITTTKEGEYNVKVFYEKGIYLQSSNLKNIVHYIITVSVSTVFFTGITYWLICLVDYNIKEKRKQ